MKRLKKTNKSKAQKIEDGAKRFNKINELQVIGHVRIQHPNEVAENIYTLEDGSKVTETDTGKAIKKMKKIKKRSERQKEKELKKVK